MKQILIAPGAFKNSLTATQAAAAIEAGLRDAGFSEEATANIPCTFTQCPIADGGNGTLDAFCAGADFKPQACVVRGPLNQKINAAFAMHQHTAVIEMALASGLELCDQNALDPLHAHSYGTGQLIRAALDAGATEIILGVGGSATVDAGLGCMQALGARFYTDDDQELTAGAGGAALESIVRADFSALDPRLQHCSLTIACDVDNPVIGANGSAETFAAQKGADPAQITQLATGLNHFFTLLHQQGLRDVRQTPGAGAAGSIAGGLMACCAGNLAGGFELWEKHSGFSKLVAESDILITGEGRMDQQTIHGKGPLAAAQIARAQQVIAVALVGGLDVSDSLLHSHGLDLVLPLVTQPMSLDFAISHADTLLRSAATRLGYALRLGWRA